MKFKFSDNKLSVGAHIYKKLRTTQTQCHLMLEFCAERKLWLSILYVPCCTSPGYILIIHSWLIRKRFSCVLEFTYLKTLWSLSIQNSFCVCPYLLIVLFPLQHCRSSNHAMGFTPSVMSCHSHFLYAMRLCNVSYPLHVLPKGFFCHFTVLHLFPLQLFWTLSHSVTNFKEDHSSSILL